MALMLEALDVADGDKVLEVATGTGYNAALLSHRVGDENVTTIEVDPDLARSAEQRLDRAGYRPTVLAGDGRGGHPDGGPYDRLIATCGFTGVPPAWLEQMTPGGIIVCPVGGGVARLVVRKDGTATGAFLPDAAFFMPVRGIGDNGTVPVPPPLPDSSSSRPCSVEPSDFLDGGIRFLLTLAVPRAMIRLTYDDTGGRHHRAPLAAGRGLGGVAARHCPTGRSPEDSGHGGERDHRPQGHRVPTARTLPAQGRCGTAVGLGGGHRRSRVGVGLTPRQTGYGRAASQPASSAGRLVMMPSTPAASRAFQRAGASTVQTLTATPAACRAATTSGRAARAASAGL